MAYQYLIVATVLVLSCASQKATIESSTIPVPEPVEGPIAFPSNESGGSGSEPTTVSVISPPPSPEDPITHDECRAIFDQLKSAKGLLKSQRPFLKIKRNLSQSNLTMAMTNNETGIIEVEKRLISMCNDKLGVEKRNGLAFILSHEIAHFIKRHAVVHPVVASAVSTESNDQERELTVRQMTTGSSSDFEEVRKKFALLSKKFRSRNYEAEADLEAGFLSYLAGFNTLGSAQKFLDEAYQFYNMDTVGGNYPSLAERKSIVATAVKDLDTLIQVFETANLLTAAGENQMAINCYNRILQDYQSADIWNNMGVVKMLDLSGFFDRPSVKFFFPISMNLSPLSVDRDFSIDENTDIDAIMLAESKPAMDAIAEVRDYFDKAVEVNPLNYEAHLNLSILEILKYHVMIDFSSVYPLAKDQLSFALSSALKARKIVLEHDKENKKALGDIYSMLGIIKGTGSKDNLQPARDLFNRALLEHPENISAKANLRSLDGDEFMAIEEGIPGVGTGFSTCQNEEKIRGQKKLMEFLGSDEIEWGASIDVDLIKTRIGRDTIRLDIGKTSDMDVYNVSRLSGSDVAERYTFCYTKDGYTASTNCSEISKNAPLSAIEAAYGIDGFKLESSSSTLVRYTKSTSTPSNSEGIIFELDRQGKTHQWAIYNVVKL